MLRLAAEVAKTQETASYIIPSRPYLGVISHESVYADTWDYVALIVPK